MMIEPRWKLQIRQFKRWHDLPSLLGWGWEWEVRKWADPPDWPGYHMAESGRARDAKSACYRAELAYEDWSDKRLSAPPKAAQWVSWYHDE
jgi:hypothetical protein